MYSIFRFFSFQINNIVVLFQGLYEFIGLLHLHGKQRVEEIFQICSFSFTVAAKQLHSDGELTSK